MRAVATITVAICCCSSSFWSCDGWWWPAGELGRRLLTGVQPAVRRHVCPVPPPLLHACFPTVSTPRLVAVTPPSLAAAVYADLLQRCRHAHPRGPAPLVLPSRVMSAGSSTPRRLHRDDAEDVEASASYLVQSSSPALNSCTTPHKPLSADIGRYHPYTKASFTSHELNWTLKLFWARIFLWECSYRTNLTKLKWSSRTALQCEH